MKITVIGGSGHLGALTVQALRRAGADVKVASRRGPLVLDVAKPETFAVLRGSDVVIDLVDATRSAPDALARFCVAEGLRLIEATSDSPAIERLIDADVDGPGLLVLGGGIFTGVSNLLARSVADAAAPCTSLELGISSNPYSGAGKSTVALMTAAVGLPTARYERGERIEASQLARGPELAFARGARPSLRVAVAEVMMLARSTRAPKVDVYMAPRPSLLVHVFLMLPGWLMRARFFMLMMALYFTVLRRGLLRRLATTVELVATAEGSSRQRRAVHAKDGMLAGGYALAATALLLAERPLRAHGTRYVDDLVTLDEVVTRANQLAGATLIELS